MDLEQHVDCPPLVQLAGDERQPAYPHVTGDPPAARRMLTDVSGRSVRPLEPPAAYADVPRLQLGAGGAVGPWERTPPSEP